ncbi:MAG: C-type lectin domain-containing protein [Faecalibacterium sp.]|nr:C-type lectin domain-containing protein [Ruminococcus sp.]MCM1391496.1 C-type lectin domain-containing protein [Ruminococcus sp.]MCM1485860.1 C-type lectin domain-containing protein [Faecalibacterium sp.]
MKKLLAVFLTIVMLFSCIPMAIFAVNDDSMSIENGDIDLTADSTIGEILAETISDETDVSSSYSVTAIEFNDSKATVTYTSESDCTLLVGIYDEVTGEMLTYSKENVYDFEKTATVSFEENALPEYFVVKAYLVDKEGAALCKNYVSYIYTEAFEKDFTNVTVNDFDEEKIINLDDSDITNFAVIADTTEKIKAGTDSNILQSDYFEDEVYTFTNINSEIASLKEGDIFWYDTGDDTDVIIIKIKDIKINGTTAIITPDKTSLDEVFDYVKIDESDDEYEMYFTPYYDESDENDDEVETYNTRSIQKVKTNIEGTKSVSASYPFGNGEGWKINENVKVTGSITLKVGATVKVYYKSSWFSDSYLQVEVSISPSFKVDATISAKMEDKAIKKIGDVSISPCAGLYISFTPSIVLKASAKITLSGTLTTKAGFEYNNIEGFVNKCEAPSFKPEIKIEGEFFCGIDMTPHVSIIHEKVADAGITAEAGFTIKAKNAKKSDTHSCNACLDGDIDFNIEISAYVTFLNKSKPSVKLFDLTAKLADFYYSIDHLQFGWGECPYDTKSEPVEFNGHYYKIFDTSATWTEAAEYCTSIGGHLVVITSQNEQKFIETILKYGTKNIYWLGAVKNSSHKFEWITGEDFIYTNFSFNQPDNPTIENALMMYKKNNPYYPSGYGQWNDLKDDGTMTNQNDFFGADNFGLICEWESYRDYKKSSSKLETKSTKRSAPAKISAQNISVLEEIDGGFFENKIEFTATAENIYMLYSIDGNKNIKYISQGTANKNGNVEAPFFNNVDTDTYIVGDFGDGIISLPIKVIEHVHEYSEDAIAATCEVDGYVTYTCSCGKSYTEIIPATNHVNAYLIKTVNATCTTDGYTVGTFCPDCKQYINGHEVIPSTGHTDNNNDGKCDDCGIDLGTSNPSDNCDHICHKTGFMGFIYKIIRIFWKIFKTNQYCACGVAHY